MLAPVIGSPASSSQNMISRYSCSATVAFPSIDSILDDRSGDAGGLAALHQRRDDRLVEAVAHASLGHRRVVPGGERRAQAGIALGPVGDDEEAPDRRGDLEVLDRISYRY